MALPIIALAAVVAPAGCYIAADSSTIHRGDSVTLTWSTTNATKSTLHLGGSNGGNIAVASSGSVTVTPRGTQNFYIDALNLVPHVGASFKQCGVLVKVIQ